MAFTYFFRDLEVLKCAARHLIPSISGRSRVRIWDAGCATGEEPFSLAIVLAERMGEFAFRNLIIIATDLDENDSFRPVIEAGEYPAEAVLQMPEAIRKRYFIPVQGSGTCILNERVRRRVSFVRHDLRSLKPVQEGFCMVVCKNVLLHFSPEERIQVFRMFHQAMEPGGLLVMEQTQKISIESEELFERRPGEGQVYTRLELPVQ
jgi:chemotaxis protein methyltransferase CheR